MTNRSLDGSGRFRSDRGAGLAEYGMVMALVVMVLLAGVDHFATSSRGELSSRGDTAAAQGEALGDIATGAPTTTVAGGDGAAGPAGEVSVAHVEPMVVTTSRGNGQKWNVSVTIRVVDTDTGMPVEGASVTGSWGPGDQMVCEGTDHMGNCVLTMQNIHQHQAEVTFALGAVSYTDANGSSAPRIEYPASTSVRITQPS